jgi:Rieske Fe-S protein
MVTTKGHEMADREDLAPAATRRAVLKGAGSIGAVAIGATALAACSSNQDDQGSDGGAAVPAKQIKVGDIPIGGGTIYPDQVIVVTQPVPGEFKAFSAMCMHLGCVVTKIDNGKIICPCHGSEYSIADGSVYLGPSTTALTPRTVTVAGDTLKVS